MVASHWASAKNGWPSYTCPSSYCGKGTISREIHEINKSGTSLSDSDQWLHNNFSIEVALTYFLRYFSVSNSFKEYKTIIFEAIEAYYMGMDHVAIMSLIPVFEAGLRNIQNSVLGMSNQNVSSKKFERGLKELCLNWGRRRELKNIFGILVNHIILLWKLVKFWDKHWLLSTGIALAVCSLISLLAGNWQAGVFGIGGAYGWYIAH